MQSPSVLNTRRTWLVLAVLAAVAVVANVVIGPQGLVGAIAAVVLTPSFVRAHGAAALVAGMAATGQVVVGAASAAIGAFTGGETSLVGTLPILALAVVAGIVELIHAGPAPAAWAPWRTCVSAIEPIGVGTVLLGVAFGMTGTVLLPVLFGSLAVTLLVVWLLRLLARFLVDVGFTGTPSGSVSDAPA